MVVSRGTKETRHMHGMLARARLLLGLRLRMRESLLEQDYDKSIMGDLPERLGL